VCVMLPNATEDEFTLSMQINKDFKHNLGPQLPNCCWHTRQGIGAQILRGKGHVSVWGWGCGLHASDYHTAPYSKSRAVSFASPQICSLGRCGLDP